MQSMVKTYGKHRETNRYKAKNLAGCTKAIINYINYLDNPGRQEWGGFPRS